MLRTTRPAAESFAFRSGLANYSWRAVRLAAALASLALLVGCSADDEESTEEAGKQPSYAYPVEQTEAIWEPCSLHEGEDDGLAECTMVEMPLHWDDVDDGRTFPVHAKRRLGQQPSEAQLWLLAGGPGQAGTWDMPGYFEILQERYPELDVYTLDHRGTGLSGRLGCPEAESISSPSGTSIARAETPGCIDYLLQERGDELDAITTTHSAIDVAALIEAERQDEKKIFLWGGSYGTYWAQRYVQIFPDQADGILVGGIFPADGTVLWYDEHTNEVAHDFMDLCGQDDYCSGKLGADPWSRLGSLLESMQAGHCSGEGLTRDLVRLVFAYLLYWNETSILVPAATYRLERCEPEDRQAIVNLTDYLFGDGGSFDMESYSILLQHHIQFSEMWNHPAFDGVELGTYYDEVYDEAYVMKNLGPFKVELRQSWPIYVDPTWDDGWSDTTLPMLMLQGRHDPATPRREAVRVGERYSGDHQHYVEFPTAAHGTLGHTPTTDGRDCGYDLFIAFVRDPTAPLDTSCVDRQKPVDFLGSATLAEAAFGTSHLWSNEARRPLPDPRSASVDALAWRKLLRDHFRSWAAQYAPPSLASAGTP